VNGRLHLQASLSLRKIPSTHRPGALGPTVGLDVLENDSKTLQQSS